MDPRELSKRARRSLLQGKSALPAPPFYIIKAGDKVVWEGKDLQKVWPQIREDFSSERLSVSWKTPPEFLIV